MTVGKNLFAAKHGPAHESATRYGAALAAIPKEGPDLGPDAEDFRKLGDHPGSQIYGPIYREMKTNRDFLKRAADHPNHIVRGLAVRTLDKHISITNSENIDLKEIAGKAIEDPHRFVRWQAVKHTPGLVSTKILTRVSQNDSDSGIRAEANKHVTQRLLFNHTPFHKPG